MLRTCELTETFSCQQNEEIVLPYKMGHLWRDFADICCSFAVPPSEKKTNGHFARPSCRWLMTWIFTARPNLWERCICYGRHIRLSVRLPSVTLRYCVKTRELEGMRSSPSGSPVSLVIWRQELLTENIPVRVKFECTEVGPLWKQPRCIHFAS